MDSCAGNAAFAGNLQEGHTGIFNQVGKDFLVDLVDVISCHVLSIFN